MNIVIKQNTEMCEDCVLIVGASGANNTDLLNGLNSPFNITENLKSLLGHN